MSDGVAVLLAALVTGGLAGLGAGLHYLLESARQRGRAETYEAQSRDTIEAKNAELDKLHGEMDEKDETIALLRRLLDARTEARG